MSLSRRRWVWWCCSWVYGGAPSKGNLIISSRRIWYGRREEGAFKKARIISLIYCFEKIPKKIQMMLWAFYCSRRFNFTSTVFNEWMNESSATYSISIRLSIHGGGGGQIWREIAFFTSILKARICWTLSVYTAPAGMSIFICLLKKDKWWGGVCNCAVKWPFDRQLFSHDLTLFPTEITVVVAPPPDRWR